MGKKWEKGIEDQLRNEEDQCRNEEEVLLLKEQNKELKQCFMGVNEKTSLKHKLIKVLGTLPRMTTMKIR